MPDLVNRNLEDIYRIVRNAGLPPQIATLFINQHEEIVALQNYCTQLSGQMSQLIEAVKLSQALYKEQKAKLDRLNRTHTDQTLSMITTEEASGG